MSDGTERLCRLLYGRSAQVDDYTSDVSVAKILSAAADMIELLRYEVEGLRSGTLRPSAQARRG